MKMLVIAAVAASCLAAPAVAGQPPVRITVSAAGLDLATERGRTEFDRRIWRAAVAACGPTSAADPAGATVARRCAVAAAAAAHPQRDRLAASAVPARLARR